MYAEKKLLSLLIITMCLVPFEEFQATLTQVPIIQNVALVISEKELTDALKENDKKNKLTVTYVVYATDEYDYIFNNLAKLCPQASFKKMDATTFKNEAGELVITESFTQPSITLHRFSLSKVYFSGSNQEALQKIIEQHIDMTLEQFQASQTEVPTIQNVQDVKSETELKTTLDVIDKNDELAVIYLVSSTDEYDYIFNNLAILCPKASFIKTDTSTFTNAAGQLTMNGSFTQPQITLHKFKLSKVEFSASNQGALQSIINQHIDMTFEEFQENLTQEPFIQNVEHVVYETQLTNAFKAIDENDKLAVMYVVFFTDEYDYIFDNLAILCPNASFIKMDAYTFKNEAGELVITESFTQPSITLHRFGLSKVKFSASNQKALQNIIKQHITMTLEQFQASQTEVPTIQNVQDVKSETELKTTLDVIDKNDELAVICLVSSTDEYDYIFNNLAILCPKASFIKKDTSTFTNAAGQLTMNGSFTQPQITLHKFKLSKVEFSASNQGALQSIINQHIDMTLAQFQESQAQVPIIINVKDVVSETELKTVLDLIDKNNKLAVIYRVDSTDEYDDMFNNLAILCPKASFIKKDASTFKNEAGELVKTVFFLQPSITLHRFGLSKNNFNNSDQGTLQDIINQHIAMTLEEFQGSLTQLPTVKDAQHKYH